jgi:hypothetical protein
VREYTREDIEAFFMDVVKNDSKEHMVTGIYWLKCLSQPAWLLNDQTFGTIIQEPMEVSHVVYLSDGKLAMCWIESLKKL